jgi:hypothetical protein
MILRSVMKHVRDQNWFAVFLDFLIVVVGVFIGIQVANWNEARLEKHQEALLIQRLVVDFERIAADAQRSREFHQARVSEFKTLLRSLRTGSLASEDRIVVARALFNGITLQTSADRSGTFAELLSSGRAYLLKDQALLNELVAYEDFLERFRFAHEYLMNVSMGAQPAFSVAFEYDPDALERVPLSEDFVELSSVTYDFESMASDPAFYNAAEQLMLVHSFATLWRVRISKRIGRIQALLSSATP